MNVFNYSSKATTDIASELAVDLNNGLDANSVAERVVKYGLNKLAIRKTSGLNIFLRQFKSAFVYLLLGAMAVTIFLGETENTLMIFLFLAINSILGFYQEYSSEKTAQLLNKYTLPRARVLRSGKVEQITSDQLVPGDIVMLETGDKVPADIRLTEEDNITIDETVLTGESVPVSKKTERLDTVPTSYHDAVNLAFSGTEVLKGEACGIVIGTGLNTAFGQIAKLTGESRKVSDFQKGISHFSQFILKLIGITLVVMFVAHILISRNGIDIFELIIFSVALTVSVIPEALPLVTTFSLARGAKRLAEKKVIVKRLSAIEDLGGIEILCCDKTGTLTENKLSIVSTYSKDIPQTIWLANLASDFELEQKIEPFDIALEQGLLPDQKTKIKQVIKIAEESFDPRTRQNSTLIKADDKSFIIIRGAPDGIISSCSGLDARAREEMDAWTNKEGKLGHRVLAVGFKEVDIADQDNYAYEKELEEKDFQLSGIISFADPVKKSSVSAVRQAKELGVKIKIISGDSAEVTGAVANEIGLIDAPDQVITGADWQKASEEEKLEFLEHYEVFARISPQEKFAIIEALRKTHMIGFLGEGINDAPALKVAGVSLAVDSAADIAREASDIILLSDNLEVIIDGIREGRQVFANTIKYIKSTLASNFGNFFAVATASLMIDFLPMLPIQILLLNLLSDTPMISISTDNVEASELTSPMKYQAKDVIIIAIILGVVSMVFDFIFFGMFYRISPGVLQTNWFIGSILTELVLLFSIRTRLLFFKSLRPSNSIIYLSILTIILTIGLPYTGFGQKYFHFVAPTQEHMVWILSLVAAYFVISESVKLWYYKSVENNQG